MTKKRHHYIPIAYLKSFCGSDGKLYVYRKDDPTNILHQLPNTVGFQNYYYSQPLPDGGYDHDKLEDFFCMYEGLWPKIVEKFRAKKDVNCHLNDIIAFIALQRARVPASRDVCEKSLAEIVISTARQLVVNGVMPPPPKCLNLNNITAAINPHWSIHMMLPAVKGTYNIMNLIGIGILHNQTKIPFLTSDNPVIWLDPSLPANEMCPYTIRKNGPIMFLFPVAPDLLIIGGTIMRDHFIQHGISYGERKEVDETEVNRFNHFICQFAYETVFANSDGFVELVKKYVDISPVINTETIPAINGQFFSSQYVWGKRTRKPKWKN